MKCMLCPRKCGADRETMPGFCSCKSEMKVAKVMLHKWEEPCISGKNGTGAVFFSGCPLKCVMCQNKDISRAETGKSMSQTELYDTFFSLDEMGAESISLITAGQFADKIIPSLKKAREDGLALPVVYNTSGYESVETLKMLEGLVDVYLPDFKYINKETAKRYSLAPDYPEVALAAIDEMTRQKPVISYSGSGIMTSGVIIRHLLLPGRVAESKEALKLLFDRYRYMVVFSLMSQYTPVLGLSDYPELCRRVTDAEYDALVDFCADMGMDNAYTQELSSASEEFIPEF